MSTQKFKLGVLGSGKGSNFITIADACARGEIQAEVSLVLSDVRDAKILEHTKSRGLRGEFLDPGPFRTKLDPGSEQRYIDALLDARVDLVVLAGFMRVLKSAFLAAFRRRIVNIHPSLLPAFPGLMAWKQALDYGVKVTGCTVHFVDEGVDSGPIIGQQTVPVLDNDTAETLHARIQEAEHQLYPRCIARLARGELQVQGRRIFSARGGE